MASFESVASGNKILRCFPRGGHNDLIGHPGYFGSLNSFFTQNYCIVEMSRYLVPGNVNNLS